ncbi:UNKNOWN [Stylonychia lemnae]|uniref:Uncharacterized protein n=1 Tax=Stylonychia lemnae TaxID=5949 RepID=A0A077ZRJ5_STYLE|nr:UNKNOWN [Stylonychia lemnae]|eukprot:CDW72538.1 UNKNOWN [Stylonychia lemnae]
MIIDVTKNEYLGLKDDYFKPLPPVKLYKKITLRKQNRIEKKFRSIQNQSNKERNAIIDTLRNPVSQRALVHAPSFIQQEYKSQFNSRKQSVQQLTVKGMPSPVFEQSGQGEIQFLSTFDDYQTEQLQTHPEASPRSIRHRNQSDLLKQKDIKHTPNVKLQLEMTNQKLISVKKSSIHYPNHSMNSGNMLITANGDNTLNHSVTGTALGLNFTSESRPKKLRFNFQKTQDNIVVRDLKSDRSKHNFIQRPEQILDGYNNKRSRFNIRIPDYRNLENEKQRIVFAQNSTEWRPQEFQFPSISRRDINTQSSTERELFERLMIRLNDIGFNRNNVLLSKINYN